MDEFLGCYDELFPFIHPYGLTPDYRSGKGRVKPLRDETTPTARVVRQHAAPDDRIQFPLDSGVPDCNIWHRAPLRHRIVEISIAQGKERFFLNSELNATGSSRGFLGLTDDRTRAEFEDAMRQE